MNNKTRDKFSISFKNNQMEQAIKDYLNAKFNPTNYIKELIYNDMIGQGSVLVQQKPLSDDDVKELVESMKKQPLVIQEETKVEKVGPAVQKENKVASTNKLAFDPTIKPF